MISEEENVQEAVEELEPTEEVMEETAGEEERVGESDVVAGEETTEESVAEPTEEPAAEPEEEPYEMVIVDLEAGKVAAGGGVEKAINDLLKIALMKNQIDAVLVPHRVPSGDSYTYLLIKDPAILEQASPLAPIMTTQGARALSLVTKLGTGGLKIAAVMRPCEVRATIELSKLEQNILNDVTLISMDCPGVLSTKMFNEDPDEGVKAFEKGMKDWKDESMRPLCQICDNSNSVFGDIHIASLGVDAGNVLLIQRTQKGADILAALGINTGESMDAWQAKVSDMVQARQEKRAKAVEDIKKEKLGLENLLDTFSTCVKCLNCMRVCPVDYCQQCYFECDDMKYPPEDYLARSQNTGSLRFPPDSLQYHLGRMLHMAMSCVSCGTCEDACPMHIPVGQVYSAVADDVQGVFEYLSGRDPKEPRPLATYQEEEFKEVEY